MNQSIFDKDPGYLLTILTLNRNLEQTQEKEIWESASYIIFEVFRLLVIPSFWTWSFQLLYVISNFISVISQVLQIFQC